MADRGVISIVLIIKTNCMNIMKNTLLWALSAALCLPLASASAQENIQVGNTTRNMITYVPEGLPAYNAPLVISLHGMGQDANYQRNTNSKWDAVADTAKFVMVYPNGNNKSWDIGGDTDIRFIETIIDTMYNRYHINRNRVYLSGFSMGGMMTYHAMSRLSDKIAAFGPVSGIPVDYRNPSGPRAVPIIHTHGTADNVVYYNGDPNHVAGGYGSIPEYVKKWAKFDGCDVDNPTVIKPYPSNKPGSAATYTKYSGGKNGVEVVLMSIEGKGHWQSEDAASVITSQEIWNFCKRFSLGPEPPVPPILTSAEPEDRSFDLPASTQEFVFTFDKAVDCGQVTAELAGDGGTYPLQLAETGFSETLTFSLPEGENVPDGDYTLSLRNIVGENEAKAETYTYHYTLGLTEVGLEIDIDTLLLPDWAAEQSTVGEGIPTGWKRVNSRADGSKDEQGSGAANVAGARLKYFPAGGDFVSGFYLSARDYDVCRFAYGDYEDYRLHLVPGRYKLSFRSVYWSAGSETGKATFNAEVTGIGSGAVAFSGGALLSSGCMNEVSTTAVSGSYLHEYTFEVTAEDDYRLEFNMSQGWSSVIIGAVKLTTEASVADVYKGGFLRAMHEAQIVYDGTSGERYAASKDLRDVLGELLERYDGFASTSPSRYEVVTDSIVAATEPLALRKENVDYFSDVYTLSLEVLAECQGNPAYEQTSAYERLLNAVDMYSEERMDMTDDDLLVRATQELWDAVEMLREVISGVSGTLYDGVPVSVEYFTLDGKPANATSKGVVIVKERDAAGNVRTWKRISQ